MQFASCKFVLSIAMEFTSISLISQAGYWPSSRIETRTEIIDKYTSFQVWFWLSITFLHYDCARVSPSLDV